VRPRTVSSGLGVQHDDLSTRAAGALTLCAKLSGSDIWSTNTVRSSFLRLSEDAGKKHWLAAGEYSLSGVASLDLAYLKEWWRKG